MALQLRKLMSASATEAVSELCDPYCDDSNESATCPSSCFSLCPDYCNTILYPPPYNDYDPPDPPPGETRLNLTWVVLIAVAAAVTIIVFAALFLKTRQRMRRRRRNQGHQPPPPEEEQTLDREFLDQDRGPVVEHHIWYINTVGLQQSVIDSIAVCKYKTGEGLVDGTECSVCLSEFEEDETLRLLPKCSHAFHIPCIDTWLRSHTNCPMCRAPIVRSNASTPPAGGSTIPDPITGEEELVDLESRVQSGGEDEQGSEAEEEGELEAENRAKDETQLIRRSVSLDSLSASKISVAVASAFPEEIDGNSSTQMMKLRNGTGENRVVEEQKFMKLVMAGSSVQRSFRRGSTSSLMRSLSCSGRLFLSTHGRSRSSVLPL